MKLADFKNKRVTVMGLGLHGGGVGVVQFLAKAGAKVLVTDLREKEELQESLDKLKDLSVEYSLGQHREEDFINTDLVIKNPAVPDDSKFLQIATKHKVAINTDVGIFFKLCPAPVIGITGTKGKSTTATLIFELLSKKGPTILAGNIGQSVLTALDKIDSSTFVVLELSSWQLAGLKTVAISPHLAVITNILPDHLNRYADMEAYVKDKKLIYQWQNAQDLLILNASDPSLLEMAKEAKSKPIFYAAKDQAALPGQNLTTYVKDKKIFYNSTQICSIENIALLGKHNISHVLAAVTVSQILGVDKSEVRRVLKTFKAPAGRLQLIRELKGVKYINDTTATMPDACVAALESFDSHKIVLIAGGADKELDFEEVGKVIATRAKQLILLKGSATEKLAAAVVKHNDQLAISRTDDMNKAVALAAQKADLGDIVLLSPACASFGLFRHEFERGDKFNLAVNKLK